MTTPTTAPRRYPDDLWALDHASSGDRIRLFEKEIGIPRAYAEIRIPSNEVYVEIGGGYGGMALMTPLDPMEVGCRACTGALPTLDAAHKVVEDFIEVFRSLSKKYRR